MSNKARSGIRQSLKSRQRTESIALGRKLLNRSLVSAGTSINDLDFGGCGGFSRSLGAQARRRAGRVGMGEIPSYAVAQRLLAADNPDFQAVPVEHDGPVAVRTGEGLVITCGRCCGPVPGDPIVGHITSGKGFVVHTETCKTITRARRRKPEQFIPARWTQTADSEFLTLLRIDVNRRKGIIADLAASVAAADAGVEEINVAERNAHTSSVSVVVGVSDRNHLARVMRRLRVIPSVLTMARGGL